MMRLGWAVLACVGLLALGCQSKEVVDAPAADGSVTVTGKLVSVKDDRPADGGVDLTVETSNGKRETVIQNDPASKLSRESAKTASVGPTVVQTGAPPSAPGAVATPQPSSTVKTSQPGQPPTPPGTVRIQNLFGDTVISEGAQERK